MSKEFTAFCMSLFITLTDFNIEVTLINRYRATPHRSLPCPRSPMLQDFTTKYYAFDGVSHVGYGTTTTRLSIMAIQMADDDDDDDDDDKCWRPRHIYFSRYLHFEFRAACQQTTKGDNNKHLRTFDGFWIRLFSARRSHLMRHKTSDSHYHHPHPATADDYYSNGTQAHSRHASLQMTTTLT